MGSASVTYTVVPESRVTTSSLCPFDVNPELDGQQFRLIFTQDPTNPSTYKLTASNPGQFYYNVFYVGEPEAEVALNIDIPEPFVTQGSVPIHVYSDVSIDEGGCFVPSGELSGFTIAQTDGQIIVSGSVPSSGLVYVTVHLDYGLKKTVGYTKDASNNALNSPDINDLTDYVFTVSDAMTDTQTIENQNVFKRDPGFAGMVTDSDENPVPGVTVEIYSPTGSLLATVSTDVDGYYFCSHKHTGKTATYTVTLPDYSLSTRVPIKANALVEVNFTIP